MHLCLSLRSAGLLLNIEGSEEPEKLLKNPYFAFYTLFLIAIFILAYIFR
jgi:hypothetical protein